MRTRRRDIEGISLSFLDVISCGFGAIILLLVLTKVFEPIVFEESLQNLEAYLARLQEQLFDIRGEARAINRELLRKEDQQKTAVERLEELNLQLTALRSKFDALEDRSNVDNKVEGQLARARQSLTAEMARLLADFQREQDDNTVGGIPVDSEYVIFIIDTSGSMRTYAWSLVLQKLNETLEVYPRLKGIQVMNDMGDYMFSQYAGDWIPDTPARRRAIMERMRDWQAGSNSSPVEGITKAIATYYQPGRNISLYVFGDEFTGNSIQRVVNTVDRINTAGPGGERLVRIHAVGFPVQLAQPPDFRTTGIMFARLMRVLCEKNGGTFVGLNDFRML